MRYVIAYDIEEDRVRTHLVGGQDYWLRPHRDRKGHFGYCDYSDQNH